MCDSGGQTACSQLGYCDSWVLFPNMGSAPQETDVMRARWARDARRAGVTEGTVKRTWGADSA